MRRSSGSRSTGRSVCNLNDEPCLICGEMVKYKSDIGRHNKLHAPNKEKLMVRCPKCSYKTLQRSNLATHAAKEHGILKLFFCKESKTCTFCTSIPASLMHHKELVHHDESCVEDDWQERRAPYERKAKRSRIAPDAYDISAAGSNLHEDRPTLALPSYSRGCHVENQLLPQCPTTALLPQEAAYRQTTNANYQHGQYAPRNGFNVMAFPGRQPWYQWDQWGQWQVPNVAACPMAYNALYPQVQQDIWASQPIALPQLLDPVLQASLPTSASSPAPSYSSSSSDTVVDAFAGLQRSSASPSISDPKPDVPGDMVNTRPPSDVPPLTLNHPPSSTETASSFLPGIQPTDIDAPGSSASSLIDPTAEWLYPTFNTETASSFLPGMQSANINPSASLPADTTAAWRYMPNIDLTSAFLPGMQPTNVDPLF